MRTAALFFETRFATPQKVFLFTARSSSFALGYLKRNLSHRDPKPDGGWACSSALVVMSLYEQQSSK